MLARVQSTGATDGGCEHVAAIPRGSWWRRSLGRPPSPRRSGVTSSGIYSGEQEGGVKEAYRGGLSEDLEQACVAAQEPLRCGAGVMSKGRRH